MIEVLTAISLLIGLFFVITAAVGVLKFKDVYTRLHAASKAGTFGFGFIIIGVAISTGTDTDIAKAFMAVVFQFLTTPVSAHMIARTAVQKGLRPVRNARGELLGPS